MRYRIRPQPARVAAPGTASSVAMHAHLVIFFFRPALRPPTTGSAAYATARRSRRTSCRLGRLTQRAARPSSMRLAPFSIAAQAAFVVLQPLRSLYRVGTLPQPARQVPAHRLAGARAELRRRRDRRRRYQHGTLADLQGRPHQRGADGGDPSPPRPAARSGDQDRRHAPSLRPARPERRRRPGRPRTRGPGGFSRCGVDLRSRVTSSQRSRRHSGRHPMRYSASRPVRTATPTRWRGRITVQRPARRQGHDRRRRMAWDTPRVTSNAKPERFVRDGAVVECR